MQCMVSYQLYLMYMHMTETLYIVVIQRHFKTFHETFFISVSQLAPSQLAPSQLAPSPN